MVRWLTLPLCLLEQGLPHPVRVNNHSAMQLRPNLLSPLAVLTWLPSYPQHQMSCQLQWIYSHSYDKSGSKLDSSSLSTSTVATGPSVSFSAPTIATIPSVPSSSLHDSESAADSTAQQTGAKGKDSTTRTDPSGRKD